ncbi:hypothetical protein [Embleya sp. MST-111070]|uniref:hypothetical protein n=1 Tax=Embleya sp. MST-111070 TaxID=3398231 RepID=UPI003F7377D7
MLAAEAAVKPQSGIVRVVRFGQGDDLSIDVPKSAWGGKRRVPSECGALSDAASSMRIQADAG